MEPSEKGEALNQSDASFGKVKSCSHDQQIETSSVGNCVSKEVTNSEDQITTSEQEELEGTQKESVTHLLFELTASPIVDAIMLPFTIFDRSVDR